MAKNTIDALFDGWAANRAQACDLNTQLPQTVANSHCSCVPICYTKIEVFQTDCHKQNYNTKQTSSIGSVAQLAAQLQYQQLLRWLDYKYPVN